MSDKTLFGCAETGTYSTDAPNPHVALSGTASTSYSIAQLFADAMSSDETATVSVVKDKDNWAVYSGAKFTNNTVDTLDLSVATLQESKGTLSDEDAVTCLGLAPIKRMNSTKVWLNSTDNPSTSSETKVELDTVAFDEDGWWDSGNKRISPKKAGYYLVTGGIYYDYTVNQWIYGAFYKSGSFAGLVGITTTVANTIGAAGSSIMYLNGSTDYVELYAKASSTSLVISKNQNLTFLSVTGPLA